MIQLLDERLPQRFWDKVLPCPMSGCWLWVGAQTTAGYGLIRIQGNAHYVHRLAFLTLGGAIPPGTEIDHLCRVRSCCNPAHLEAVTRQVNVERGEAGAYWAAKTHCPRGHKYDSANTYITATGGRVCRACIRVHSRNYKQRRKENAHAYRP